MSYSLWDCKELDMTEQLIYRHIHLTRFTKMSGRLKCTKGYMTPSVVSEILYV